MATQRAAQLLEDQEIPAPTVLLNAGPTAFSGRWFMSVHCAKHNLHLCPPSQRAEPSKTHATGAEISGQKCSHRGNINLPELES